jgi:hypothetical protein
MPHQTWILGNTLSDLLIASAMLYHVSSFWLAVYGIIGTLIVIY